MVWGKAACMESLDRNQRTIVKVASKPDGGASAVRIAGVSAQRYKGHTQGGGHREGSQWDSPRWWRRDNRHRRPLEVVMSRERF